MCMIFSALLQCFVLAVFCWMLTEFLQLYLCTHFGWNRGSSRFKYFAILGWGMCTELLHFVHCRKNAFFTWWFTGSRLQMRGGGTKGFLTDMGTSHRNIDIKSKSTLMRGEARAVARSLGLILLWENFLLHVKHVT